MAGPPPATEQRQAVTEAVVRRPLEVGGRGGYKSEVAETLAQRVYKENPRSLLEELRQRKPVENPKAQHVIERNIAGERNPDGTTKRSAEQQRRFEEANKWNNLTQALIEKGIDGVSAEQRKMAIEQVRDNLQRLIPEAEKLWWGLSAEQINDEISRLLKDTDFVAKVRELHGARTGESSPITIDLAAIKAKFEAAKTKKDQTDRDLAQNNGERENVTAQLEQFEDRTTTGGRKGIKLEELEKLEEEAPDLIARQEEIQGTLDGAQARIRDLENTQLALAIKGKALPELDAQLSQKRAEVDSYRKGISTVRTRLARREALQREKAELQERKGQLERQRIDHENAASEATREHSLAQADLDSISLERTQAEEEFVAGLKNILRDATFEYLTDKISTGEQTSLTMLDEEIAQTQDKAEKAFLSGVKGRYVGKPHKEKVGGIFGRGGKEVWVPGLPRAEVIDADYQKYLESGNPMPLLRSLLESGRDPTTGERLLIEAQVEAKLADKEFVQKWGTRAIEEMLRARLKSGEITENEAKIIVDHEWGAAAIQEAIRKNPAASEQLEELKAQTGEKDERKLLAKLSGKSLLMLLLMILGSAVVSIVGGLNVKEALRTE